MKAILGLLAALISANAAELRVRKDIEYARPGELSIRLDLYQPEVQTGPLIVYVHGGAWRSGSKEEMPLKFLVQEGCAAASVEYRLSPVAKFPAQVHDIKAAIRFLRAEAAELKLDARRVLIAGSSAGGHLAALVGVSNGHAGLEGSVGNFRDADSSVQGIISFYGAANLTTILNQSTPHGLSVRVPALELLLGGLPEQKPELARLASPVVHVDPSDPPLLLLHGDQDAQMPVNQSLELAGAYKAAGLRPHLEVVHGGAHGGKLFYDENRLQVVREFLRKYFQ